MQFGARRAGNPSRHQTGICKPAGATYRPQMARILVIDDEFGIRRLLCVALEGMGYAVSEASNGREGLAVFAKHPTDLVITDLVMPEKEGIETIRSLRRTHPHLKIIAISGGNRAQAGDNLKMAKNLGANEVLAKPFKIDELAKVVERLLGALPSDDGVSPIDPE